MTGFQSRFGHGFRITFANGWGVSVQWGPMNYCSNKDKAPSYLTAADLAKGAESADAEVAVFRPNGEFAQLSEFDQVEGYLTPDKVLALMNTVASGQFVEATKHEFND